MTPTVFFNLFGIQAKKKVRRYGIDGQFFMGCMTDFGNMLDFEKDIDSDDEMKDDKSHHCQHDS